MALIGGCMGSSYQTRTITAQALSVQGFFLALSQTEDTVKDERRQAVEQKEKNMWPAMSRTSTAESAQG
jgi:hypothetical protein